MTTTLSVREVEARDIAVLDHYWQTLTDEDLQRMFIDKSKLPTSEEFTAKVTKVISTPVGERQADPLIWELNGRAVGFTTLNNIEKGKQAEYLHLGKPDWVRAEIQVRPAKEAKTEFSHLTALEAWGASTWSRELAGLILQEHVDPHAAGTTYRKSSLERKLTFLCKQYGPTLVELHSLLGSWECVGLTLSEKINELNNGVSGS